MTGKVPSPRSIVRSDDSVLHLFTAHQSMAYALDFILDTACLNGFVAFNLVHPTWNDSGSFRRLDKRCLFLIDVGESLVQPFLLARSANTSICRRSDVARAMQSQIPTTEIVNEADSSIVSDPKSIRSTADAVSAVRSCADSIQPMTQHFVACVVLWKTNEHSPNKNIGCTFAK